MAPALLADRDVLDIARSIGVDVLTDADAHHIVPSPEALRLAPAVSPNGPVPWDIRDGFLRCLWAPTPTPADVTAFARIVGMPVEVVLASTEVLRDVLAGTQPNAKRPAAIDPERILHDMIGQRATDLHLSPGTPPILRVGGNLAPLHDAPVLDAAATSAIARWMTGSDHERDADRAFNFGGVRFRVNVYVQRGAVSIACRALPERIPTLDELGLPGSVRTFARLQHGLVIACGPTGSGKSSTLAALVDLINRTRAAHITTIEDPVEYVHGNERSLVHQREIGRDVDTFASALRSALRQDPDVLLVGEMRDGETIDAALTAAETGHLVLSTLHTGDAESSVGRIINAFPSARQSEARVRLATVLQALICQKLLPRTDPPDSVGLVTEILVNTRAVASLIRTGDTHQIRSVVETGARDGMHTFDQTLARAVREGWLDRELARANASDDEAFAGHLKTR